MQATATSPAILQTLEYDSADRAVLVAALALYSHQRTPDYFESEDERAAAVELMTAGLSMASKLGMSEYAKARFGNLAVQAASRPVQPKGYDDGMGDFGEPHARVM